MSEVLIVGSSDDEVEVARPAAPGGWACSACTFLNPSTFLACSVCGTERRNPQQQQQQHPGTNAANTTAAAAAAPRAEDGQREVEQQPRPGLNSGKIAAGWMCEACTYRNAAGAPACDMCGRASATQPQPPPAAAAGAAAAAASVGTVLPGPAAQPAGQGGGAAGAAPAEAAALPEVSGTWVLDCGCHLAAQQAQQHLQQQAAALPPGLAAAAGCLCCPVQGCRRGLTRRDVEALLGERVASQVDRHLWVAAATLAAAAPAGGRGGGQGGAAAGGGDGGSGGEGSDEEIIDLIDSPPPMRLGSLAAAGSSADGAAAAADNAAEAEAAAPAAADPFAGGGQVERQCAELAGLLLQLHEVLVKGELPPAQQDPEPAEDASRGGRRRGRSASGAGADTQQQQGGGGRRRGRAVQQGAAQQAQQAKAWQQPPAWVPGGVWGGYEEGMLDGEEEEDEEEDEDMDGEGWGMDVGAPFADPLFWGGGRGGRGGSWGGFWGGGRGGRGGGWGGGRGQLPAKARPKGVGYGGGGGPGSGSKQARQRQAAAAERQEQLDAAAAALLAQLRQRLQTWTAVAQERVSPLPLPLLGALRGGPAAPLLRLLLHNDSLMDVSARRQLYTEVFSLVGVLAGSTDLLPLLLQPADSDLLKSAGPPPPPAAATQQQDQQRPGPGGPPSDSGPPAKRPRRGAGSASRTAAKARAAGGSGGAPAAAAADADAAAGAGKGQEEEKPALAHGPAAPSEDSSCWQALQALRLQADIFRRNAEQLAAEGDEDDVALVGALLDVSECCSRVQAAVDLWRSSVQQPPPPTAAHDAQQAQQAQQPLQAQQAGSGGGPAPDQRQRYERALKPLLFQSCPLLADHYFQRQAGAAAGAVSDRLRRITKEVATLPGQLPLGWESSVLVAMDNDRMDVLRALIFAPPDTPYAYGAFAFDILLPPEYPSRPPLVRFLTTGGGRVRFNPNLYDDGKVCLSLLGTWQGPGWQPGQSTLLQVLVSIQSMILGTSDPFFNEPGYEGMEGTPQGRQQSQRYNAGIRRHTLEVAVLGQLQRSSSGFEEAIRLHFSLKAGEVRQQARQWAREDGSLKQLSAQVSAALDALVDRGQ